MMLASMSPKPRYEASAANPSPAVRPESGAAQLRFAVAVAVGAVGAVAAAAAPACAGAPAVEGVPGVPDCAAGVAGWVDCRCIRWSVRYQDAWPPRQLRQW